MGKGTVLYPLLLGLRCGVRGAYVGLCEGARLLWGVVGA